MLLFVDGVKPSKMVKEPFDPEGTDYDYESAEAAGMLRDATGHMGSVARASPEDIEKYGLRKDSYLMLKGKNHDTWDLAVEAEKNRNSTIQKHDNRYYSVPNKPRGIKAAIRGW